MQFSVGACRMGDFFAKIVCGITDNRRIVTGVGDDKQARVYSWGLIFTLNGCVILRYPS